MPKLEKAAIRTRERLLPPVDSPKNRDELLSLYQRFFRVEEYRIRLRHHAGAEGLEVAGMRSDLLDMVLKNLFTQALLFNKVNDPAKPPVTLVATGGYGRGLLNPCSDVDLFFLLPAGSKLSAETEELIQKIICMLWDVGFKLGHAVRSIRESIAQANRDPKTKASLIEARLVVGDDELFQQFRSRFEKQCIAKHKREFLTQRREDMRQRREKWRTIYLQEPHVKNGCGGLRDYHNLIWITYLEFGSTDLRTLVRKRILTAADLREIERAYNFVHRVRNELHYHTGKATDILTLQLQGVVATNFNYPSRNILRRVEAFMRDYYKHTRSLYRQTWRVMERLHLAHEEEDEHGLTSFLARRRKKREYFDGFFSWKGRVYPRDEHVFQESPERLMGMFQHAQQRHLTLSPQALELVHSHYHLINKEFRYNKRVRLIFEAILSRRGNVAGVLKLMHRAGVLGRYLPEFGALDCLVQHEFFHRYTADHHTLMCIRQLDRLSESTDPKQAFYSDLFRSVEDPYALYLAFILHDTGRAENVRYHTDASATLAARVCRRLQIRSRRRQLILFLVDHHLTFWRTATTMPIDDPETISHFAGQMKGRRHLDLLLLFTYADSKGTNEEAWSEWKEMLMRQLYQATLLYWKDHAALDVKSDDLKLKVAKLLGPEYAEAIDVHFRGMPDRYFRCRSPSNIGRDIRLIRSFHEELSQTGDRPHVVPASRWIDHGEAHYSEFIVCGKDRHLLLARISGVLSAHTINILSADFFRRADETVLDLFRVCTTDFEAVTNNATRHSVEKLMLDAFRSDDFDLTAHIQKAAKAQAIDPVYEVDFPQRVHIDNHLTSSATVIEIQAVDRLGLLHDCFRAIGSLGHQVTHSRIVTEKGAAIDTIYVTNREGSKLKSSRELQELQAALEALLGIQDRSA